MEQGKVRGPHIMWFRPSDAMAAFKVLGGLLRMATDAISARSAVGKYCIVAPL